MRRSPINRLPAADGIEDYGYPAGSLDRVPTRAQDIGLAVFLCVGTILLAIGLAVTISLVWLKDRI